MSKEESKITKAAEVYAGKTVLRAAVASIPYIGGAVDIFIADRGQKIVQTRILRMIEEIKTAMSEIEKDKLNSRYLESEEFFDMLVNTFEQAAKTRSEEKIRIYAQILRGAVTTRDSKETHSPETYLWVIAELTPVELEVARAIYLQQLDETLKEENELKWAREKGWEKLPDQCTGVPKEDLPFILTRLSKSGLIREITGVYVGYTGGVYVVTDVFRKLMRFIDYEKTSTK